jgi:tetratricopeptide (TPR) repeat protein
VYLAAAIAQPVLAVIVAIKAEDDYVSFVRFVKGVLLFETINIAYQQGVQQYIKEFNFGYAFLIFVIVLAIGYFTWYRLNVKYFEKRIAREPLGKAEDIHTEMPHNDTPGIIYSAVKTQEIVVTSQKQYCRKCGTQLEEKSRFCHNCGDEISSHSIDKETPIYIDSLFSINNDHTGKYVQLIGEYSWIWMKKEPLKCNISQYSMRGDMSVAVELTQPLPDYVVNASSGERQPIILRGTLCASTGTYERYVLKEAELQGYWRDTTGKVRCDKSTCRYMCSNDCPIHLNNCGKIKYDAYNLNKAVELLQRAVFLAPDYAEAWCNLGSAYLSLQQYNDAYESFCEAGKYAPNSEQTLQGEIITLAKIGRIKDAQEQLVKYQKLFADRDLSSLSRIISDNLPTNEQKLMLTDDEYVRLLNEEGFDIFWNMLIEEKERTFVTEACQYTGASYSRRCDHLRWFASVDIGRNGSKLKHYRQTLLRDGVSGADSMLLFDVIDEYEIRYIKY